MSVCPLKGGRRTYVRVWSAKPVWSMTEWKLEVRDEMEDHKYQLTVRPLPDRSDPAGIRRLRRALKCLLRTFGLQVTDIRETKPPAKESQQ